MHVILDQNNMSIYICDVEADGPVPGIYSMVSFALVKLDKDLKTTFYAETKPISDQYVPEALAVSGFTREEHLKFEEPLLVMQKMFKFIENSNESGRPIFMSDNPAFDWQWINYYSHLYMNSNPFGHSARRIGDFYAGLNKKFTNTNGWKKHKITKHTHHPLDDAKGNAEALLYLFDKYEIKWN